MNPIELISDSFSELLVIEQKSMKIDSQVDTLQKKDRDIMQEVKNLTTRVDQLSSLLFQKKSYHEVRLCVCIIPELISRIQF